MDERIREYKERMVKGYQRSPRGSNLSERVAAVIDIEDGMTFRAASEKYGIGTNHLQRYCKMVGVESARARMTKEQMCEVVEDIRAGIPRPTIAERWNITERRVYRIGFAAGIRKDDK